MMPTLSSSARTVTRARSSPSRSLTMTTSPWISYPATSMTCEASLRITSCPGFSVATTIDECVFTLAFRPWASTFTVPSSLGER